MQETKTLSPNDHSRDSAGLRYVYPVVSRRAGGLSIGINLNPNNACNWRCIYCQVPNLRRGSAPDIDLSLLRSELKLFLDDVLTADFFDRFGVKPEYRVIRDIAISGNGEPTSARNFKEIVSVIGQSMEDFELDGKINFVLITNGSLMHKNDVSEGLRWLNDFGGEVWFKLDRATDTGLAQINNAGISAERMLANLIKSAEMCPTWVQTSVFALDGETLSAGEQKAYINFLQTAMQSKGALKGVLIYGLARPSLQPESTRLSVVAPEWIKQFANQIESLGLAVKISG